jgi:hypothetical protein
MSDAPRIAGISPQPSDDEVVAIVSAIELSWPVASASEVSDEDVERWRFSGRWWTKPLPLRRDRPW